MKSILPTVAIATAAVLFAAPALACQSHPSHASMDTVEAQSAPAQPHSIVIEPATQPSSATEIESEAAMSRPMGTTYEGCSRLRKDHTAYMTQ